jgi:hypothetical protein
MTASRGVARAPQIIGGILAVLTAAAALWGVADFPLQPIAIGVALIIYAALLWYAPWAWLIVLPAVLPAIDLASWSGRFYFDEFDFLILTTLAVRYARSNNGVPLPGLLRRPWIWPTLFVLSVLISTVKMLYPLPAIEPYSFATYLSPWNALRVAKGFFWAWLLMGVLAQDWRADPASTRTRLVTGILIGVGFMALAALWERGVLVELVNARNIYALLNNLLDFSGTYRVTGLFSGMHVGGEAIDGYLSLAAPFTLYPVLFARRAWIRLLGLVLFMGAAYAVMVTFSRGLYAGFAVSLVGVCLCLAVQHGREVREHAWAILAALALVILFTLVLIGLYARGGFAALILGIALIAATALAAAYAPARWKWLAVGVVAVAALPVAWRIHQAITTSKWSDTDAATALMWAVGATVLFVAASAVMARRVLPLVKPLSGLALLAFTGLFWLAVIPPLAGEQAQTRFSTVAKDMETRQTHWRTARAAMDPALVTQIFGNGIGSFPQLFFSYASLTGFPLATYSLGVDGEANYLRLGGGDFNLMQRVNVKPNTTYRVTARLRAEDGRPLFTASICHKNMIFSERYVPDCQRVSYRFPKNPERDWVEMNATLNTGKVGRWGVLYWPPTLQIHNARGIVQVTDFAITGPDGRNIIHNGNFTHGLDRWFLVSDFEHLAWHAKNVYLHYFIEQGGFGLLAWATFVVAALAAAARAVIAQDRLAVIVLPALISFLLTGLVGTLVDMPRIAMLFYLLLFAALQLKITEHHESAKL